MNKKPHFPPDMMMRRTEALAYMNCGGTTLDTYLRDGKITPCGQSETDPRVKFFYVKDLNKMKSMLGSRAGKRRTGSAAASMTTIVDVLPDIPVTTLDGEIPIGDLDTTQARLMEAAGIPAAIPLHKGQQLFRQLILAKAVKNKVVDTLFSGLTNPDARIQMKAVTTILSMILPQLKTIESVKIDHPEDVERQERLSADITALHERIKQLRLVPPTIIAEGVRVIDVD